MTTKTYDEALRDFQQNLLSNALVETNGNVRKAAALLGIHRNTFSRILESALELKPLEARELLKKRGLITGPKPPKAQKPQPRTIRARAA